MNWKVRFKHKAFWLALVPAVLLLIQVILAAFGIEWNTADINDKLIAIVNALFALLAILGIVTDPTTKGITDSAQALTYDAPKADDPEEDEEDEDDDETED